MRRVPPQREVINLKSRRICPHGFSIVFGNPIDPQEVTAGLTGDAAYEKLTQVLQQRIQQMLNEVRALETAKKNKTPKAFQTSSSL